MNGVASPLGQLDLATVSEVSDALSSEIELDRLLERLMQIALENAGASRGLLILPWKGEPRIEAEATTRGEWVGVRLPRTPIGPEQLPLSVFHQVSRTQEVVLVDDASLTNPFEDDAYVVSRRSRSFLCLPLLKAGQPAGVLYLESEFAPFVFTPSRIALLQLIAGQATAALANAWLYADLETAIEEFNRSEAVLAGEKRLLEMIAKGSSFGLITDVFCRIVEQLCEGSRCSVLLVDRDGRRLRHAAAPSLPPAYNEAVDGIEIGPEAGSCGAAVFSRQWVVVSDVTEDPRWALYREVALLHGIRACWSMPVFSAEGAVLGTFALYFGETRLPSAREKTLVDQLAHLASIAIVRKRGDDALRRSESYLTQAQKISRTGSFAWNAESGDMFWSDETYRIAGVDRSTLPSLELMFEQVHPEDRALIDAAIDRAMNGEGDIDLEYRRLTPAGELEHVQLLGRAVRDTSGNLELVGATMDVTARRRAADELQQAQSALSHVARVTMLGELAASMAHEINQPLSAIVADASACLNWLSADPPPLGEVREALTAIAADGKRAGDVLTRIRSLLSRSAVARELCDLSAVIGHVLPLTRAELARQGLALKVALAPEMPLVAADPVELQQVVLNLVLNAAEASRDVAGERRRILVRSFVEQDTQGAVAVCSVEDAGVGFGGRDTSRLFDAFYTTKASGLGMGLSISRSIIERHAGRLWATPNQEHGVTFAFAIPVSR